MVMNRTLLYSTPLEDIHTTVYTPGRHIDYTVQQCLPRSVRQAAPAVSTCPPDLGRPDIQ